MRLEKRDLKSNLLLPYQQRSIFNKYKFFNTGFLACLLISLLLIFITIISVYGLLSIQSPVRFETKKK